MSRLTFLPFGYKRKSRVPYDADMVIDMRKATNPPTQDDIEWAIEQVDRRRALQEMSGDRPLVIGVGCHLGRDRSPAICRALREHYG